MEFRVKKYKKEYDYSYTLGAAPTMELIKYKKDYIYKIYISSKYKQKNQNVNFEKLCDYENIPYEINDKIFDRLATKDNIFIIGVFYKYESLLEKNTDHIVLVNPGDMGYMGTIIRTSLGFGIKNIAIIAPGVDVFDPRVVRASMGAVFKMNIVYFDDFDVYQSNYNNDVYTFMLGGKKNLSDIEMGDLTNNFSLVFGNESTGLPDEFYNKGECIVINHSNEIDSLNLSLAAGIAIYQFTKNKYKTL